MKKMLLVFAHPDDESFSVGGTIPLYVEAGWEVDLVCATRGEEGDIGPLNISRNQLPDVRQKELEKAGTILGIHSITFLGYHDGALADLTPGDIEDKLTKKMTELIPDIVVTMDTTGISNHPDHIKVSYATTFAFQKYAAWAEEQLAGREQAKDALPKLYYACMPASIASYAVKNKSLPAESFGKPWAGVPDKNISTAIDISEYADVKKKALQCHVTQSDDVNRFLSMQKQPLLTHEYFMLRMHGTIEAFMGKNDYVVDHL